MSEELQFFLEDMDEQLSIMESSLLDISDVNLEEIDKEKINNIFRAMHTMKGNAGLFGYKVIVDFAHLAESLLEEIRNNRINITKELIELFLLINDHSKHLIQSTIKDEKLDFKQQEQHNLLLTQLNKYLNIEEKEEQLSVQIIEKDTSTDVIKYSISIKLEKDFFKSGMDMLSIVKYLDAIGNVLDTKLIIDEIPSFYELEPLDAYIKLNLIYETSEDKSEIVDAFEFVQEDIKLIINVIEEVVIKKQVDEKTEVNIVKEATKVIEKQKPIQKKQFINNLSLKVDSTKVDKLINQMSELVIANAKILEHIKKSKNIELHEAVEDMSDILAEVRNGVMNIRMVQVSDSFSKLRRIVSEATKKSDKEISFEIIGGETELDKTVIEKISDPLVHMLRNSVDHGIESPQDRINKGKEAKGKIILKAYHDSGTIVIEISDDGAGINKDKILKKAIERKLIKNSEKLRDKEIYDLIFVPGFSTAQEISNISGRGVGMDVVKRNIEELRGIISIDSKLDIGTTIKIRLPLTLAIIDGFLIEASNSKYIIPIDSIQECLEFTSIAQEEMKNNGYITLRSNILPILDVAKHFKEEELEKKRKNIVVVKFGTQRVGLKVDELFGEFQTVIKPLGRLFRNVSDISGGTLLGNGEIALILDIQKLIEHKISNKDISYGN